MSSRLLKSELALRYGAIGLKFTISRPVALGSLTEREYRAQSGCDNHQGRGHHKKQIEDLLACTLPRIWIQSCLRYQLAPRIAQTQTKA